MVCRPNLAAPGVFPYLLPFPIQPQAFDWKSDRITFCKLQAYIGHPCDNWKLSEQPLRTLAVPSSAVRMGREDTVSLHTTFVPPGGLQRDGECQHRPSKIPSEYQVVLFSYLFSLPQAYCLLVFNEDVWTMSSSTHRWYSLLNVLNVALNNLGLKFLKAVDRRCG